MDWKTTLLGIAEAVIIAGFAYAAGVISGDYTFTAAGFALALARAVGAYFTKDKDPKPEVK